MINKKLNVSEYPDRTIYDMYNKSYINPKKAHLKKIDGGYNSNFKIKVKYLCSYFIDMCMEAVDKKNDLEVDLYFKKLKSNNILKNIIDLSTGDVYIANPTYVIDEYIYFDGNDEDFELKNLNNFHKFLITKLKELILEIIKFNHKGEDLFYNYRRINYSEKDKKEKVSKCFQFIKNDILSEIMDFESFKIMFKDYLIDLKRDIITSYKTLPFENDSKEIYLVEKDIKINDIIETSTFPKIEILYYINHQVNSNSEISYLFVKSKHNFIISEKDKIKTYYDKYIMKTNYYLNKKNYLGVSFNFDKYHVFMNKEEAENFYKNELIKIKNKIEEVLLANTVSF